MPVLSGADTGNASAFHHGKWHGTEAELFVREVGNDATEVILANISHNAALIGLEGEVGVIAPGKLADIVARGTAIRSPTSPCCSGRMKSPP
jgi:imidazolonepropionase-like amidohydrolase